MFINMFNTKPSYYNESKNARTVTWTINNNGHLDAVKFLVEKGHANLDIANKV